MSTFKGKKFNIKSDTLLKINGTFECYNQSEDMVHLARLGKNGKKLAPSAKNLVNLPLTVFLAGIEQANVQAIEEVDSYAHMNVTRSTYLKVSERAGQIQLARSQVLTSKGYMPKCTQEEFSIIQLANILKDAYLVHKTIRRSMQECIDLAKRRDILNSATLAAIED